MQAQASKRLIKKAESGRRRAILLGDKREAKLFDIAIRAYRDVTSGKGMAR